MEFSRSLSGASTERYHAFDNLRGVMLMLLLVLHASLAYMVTPLDTIWSIRDSSRHLAFDIGGLFIHTLRLPLLFVMAGFFAAMLYYERGVREFLRNRLRRIAVPLVVFWLLLAPFILAPFALFHFAPGSRTFTDLVSWLFSADPLSRLHFFHLWFLFDLLLYYAAALLLIGIFKLTRLKWGDGSRKKLGLIFRGPWGFLIFAGLTAISLIPMEIGMLETPAAFVRPPSTLFANSIFVLFGWGLYILRDFAGRLVPRAWIYTLLGVLFFAANLGCIQLLFGGNRNFHVPSIVFASLSIWLFVYGITGLFLRYFNRLNRTWRYIADSSYWCYLVHLPLIAWLQFLLAGWNVWIILKYMIVLGITMLVCLLTYEYMVRSTLIGVLINGRRRPRM